MNDRDVIGPDGGRLWSVHTAENAGQPYPWRALIVLTVLAGALRVVGIDGGLWWDEIRTLVDSVRIPLSQIVTAFPNNNQHTLYAVLAHVAIDLFGDHSWTLRLPALIAGVVTIPVLFFLARELVGRTEALLACLLLTVSYHHVWYSQSARGYTMLLCLTLLATALLLRGLRAPSRATWSAYGMIAALGVYTHLTMVFLVVSHAVLVMLPLGLPCIGSAGWWRRWRLPLYGFTLSGVLTLLLYSPLLLDVQQFFVKEPGTVEVATSRWAIGAMLQGLQIGVGGVVGASMAGALMCGGAVSYWRQSRFVLGLFVVPGIVTVAAALLMHRPIFPRFLFFLAGFALLILVRGALEAGRHLERHVRGVRQLPQSMFGVAIVLVLALMSAAALPANFRYPKQDFIGAMRYVEAARRPGEQIVTIGGARFPYREYLHRTWTEVASAQQLAVLRGGGSRVWAVYTLPRYIAAETPELHTVLRSQCLTERVFRGTMAGGDVIVCALGRPRHSTP